eukprot:scaffold2408_cov386-Prasinococcus_capsulatus_cf.AAC.14
MAASSRMVERPKPKMRREKKPSSLSLVVARLTSKDAANGPTHGLTISPNAHLEASDAGT